jgi:hypothetical protein
VDRVDDFGVVDACRQTEVIPRLLCPSWRWMTISGTLHGPSRPRARAAAGQHFYSSRIAALEALAAGPKSKPVVIRLVDMTNAELLLRNLVVDALLTVRGRPNSALG